MSTYYTMLTVTGRNKLADAIAGGEAISLAIMALGTGENNASYDPVDTQTALKAEVYRTGIQQKVQDPENPGWLSIESVIGAEEGGWTVREVGIFDSDGDLFAIGKFPETYKPNLIDGSGKELWIKMILQISNASAVTIAVDPSIVTVTRQYLEDAFGEHIAEPDPHAQYSTHANLVTHDTDAGAHADIRSAINQANATNTGSSLYIYHISGGL